MDKRSYDDLVLRKLEEGKFHVIRKDPLPDSGKRVEKALAECKANIKKAAELGMPNPSLPRIKWRPKIHKEGNEVREINAARNSPTQNIAKWLLEEVKRLGLKIGKRAVGNSREVIARLNEAGGIQSNEILVSIDVKALFPSVSKKEALHLFEEWIMAYEDSSEWRKKAKLYEKLPSRA